MKTLYYRNGNVEITEYPLDNVTCAIMEIAERLDDLIISTVEDYDFDLEECFPTTASKTIVMGGKRYRLKMTCELEEL